jgi:hypothetical protein
VTAFFTTLQRSDPRRHTVAYALDAHPSGSRMYLVFPELTFDGADDAAAAQLLLETEYQAHGHIAFKPYDSHLVTVVMHDDEPDSAGM